MGPRHLLESSLPKEVTDMTAKGTITAFIFLTATVLLATASLGGVFEEETSWAPKPIEPSRWIPPNKPHTKLLDLKTKHQGEENWNEVVVDDDHLHAEYIQMAPNAVVRKRFHPDTREWWVVMQGQLRYEIEGQAPFVATKGSMVQVPMQTIYSMATVGNQPALRFEVNIAKAKTLYPKEVEPPTVPGIKWIPAKLNRTPGAYGRGNQPHINLYELYKTGTNDLRRFVEDDRAAANIIYGYEKDLPPLDPNFRGHYHPECAEFWLIMVGQIRYPIENQGVIIADEGDVVYVPPFTFHAPRFFGPGPSCRLAMNGYPNIAHIRQAEAPH
jgi:mannose-6-phosphate isomerase-like protein (cupin superfamily)